LPYSLRNFPNVGTGLIHVYYFSAAVKIFSQFGNELQPLDCELLFSKSAIEALVDLQVAHFVLSVELGQREPGDLHSIFLIYEVTPLVQ
jgi:hypothetical protein